MRTCNLIGRGLAASLSVCVFAAMTATVAGDVHADNSSERGRTVIGTEGAHFETFLNRLMRAESNGRDFAANPRSSALGPFQFIKSTFIDVARRHFPELAALNEDDLLALRTDRAVARRAAAIYSLESLAYLTSKGVDPSPGDLRLAYLVGPTAAARVLHAPPSTPAVNILGAPVIKANPFMAGMSTSQLAARSARDVGEHHRASVAIVAPEPHRRDVAAQPSPRVQPRPAAKSPVVATCNRKLVSCRRWMAMQANKQRVARQKAAKREAAKQAARKAASRSRVSGKRENGPGV